MTLYATESAVEDWPAAEPPSDRPERVRGAEVVAVGAADHGLGPAHAAAQRVVLAAIEALGDSPVGQVPLAVLGAALVASVPGARFDVEDRDDVAILARLLTHWWRRLLSHGADLGAPDVEALRVAVARAPTRGDDVGIFWPQVASRVELARWARRAAAEAAPVAALSVLLLSSSAVEHVAEAIAPDPDRLARGRQAVALLRADELAAGRPWPPPVPETAGRRVFSRTRHRPTMVANGLTGPVPLCADPAVPCVPVVRGRWTCPACGAVTTVPEPLTGARVPECECWEAVCAHPSARPARSRRAGGHDDR